MNFELQQYSLYQGARILFNFYLTLKNKRNSFKSWWEWDLKKDPHIHYPNSYQVISKRSLSNYKTISYKDFTQDSLVLVLCNPENIPVTIKHQVYTLFNSVVLVHQSVNCYLPTSCILILWLQNFSPKAYTLWFILQLWDMYMESAIKKINGG